MKRRTNSKKRKHQSISEINQLKLHRLNSWRSNLGLSRRKRVSMIQSNRLQEASSTQSREKSSRKRSTRYTCSVSTSPPPTTMGAEDHLIDLIGRTKLIQGRTSWTWLIWPTLKRTSLIVLGLTAPPTLVITVTLQQNLRTHANKLAAMAKDETFKRSFRSIANRWVRTGISLICFRSNRSRS